MALQSGLFKDQDQTEQDLTDGPGWTIDQQHPGMFDGLGVGSIARGFGSGVSDGINLLTHGLEYHANTDPMQALSEGPAAFAQYQKGKTELDPWQVDWNEKMQEAQNATRNYSKSLAPDPRITGSAANLVQGFSHAVTEFAAGSLAGGPVAGASLLGASEGYAHYQDLRDEGVDEGTAKKSAILTGLASGAGAVLPMSLPAKWLAGLSTTGTLLTQAGTGAAVNTAFGAASRLASAKILEDAGYPEMAEQQKPWDALNMATDAITGLFFGAHAGLHGLKVADVDPSIRDAAKVVQNRQEIADRAPGIPVDMKSAAVHRQALETALGDLMSDHPVELNSDDMDGATFARPEENTVEAREIMRDEFMKSGVLDDAAAFDRWLAGEEEPKPKEQPTAEKPPEEPAEAAEAPKGEVPEQFKKEGEEDKEPGEQANQAITERALADRPNLEIPVEREQARETRDRLSALMDRATRREAMESQGRNILEDMEERDISPRDAAQEFLKNTYPKLSDEMRTRFDRMAKGEGFEPGQVASVDREGNKTTLKDWEDVHRFLADELPAKTDHLEGTQRGYVSLMQWANERAAERSPGTALASDVHSLALEHEQQANKEAEPMFSAAVQCEARHA